MLLRLYVAIDDLRRIEELFELLKCAFGLVRSAQRASYALPIHLLVCLLVYSLYKRLIVSIFAGSRVVSNASC